MENKIFFNFSYLALKLLGSGLYSNPWNAISELVANGFDAGANDVYIYINRSNKEQSTIEIFDDGSGMTYDELVSKYVFVGRNRRAEEQHKISGNLKTLGRKGIGKLATLYLSNNVQIISKTIGGTTSWNLNITEINEDEKPALEAIDLSMISVECSEQWNKNEHGLFLRLNDVNLTGLGEQTLYGLINRLSDFYLLESRLKRIWISYVQDKTEAINFNLVKKEIAYKNFYALFNNSNVRFDGYEKLKVHVKTDFEELKGGYPVILIDDKSLNVSGKKTFLSSNGNPIEKEFNLIGWIGIHTSIDTTEAQKNDQRFLKNRATSPNRLRLYIREKLAIDNFLDYVKNTQAFSNYIEGEISFDILDDDDLPDIATANRQQLSEKDERVQLLVELLKPIINRLISARIKLSTTLKDDENLILKKKSDEISLRHTEELTKEKTEKEVAQAETELRKRQVELLAKGLRKNEKRLAESLHTINKNSVTIDSKINTIFKTFADNKDIPAKIIRDISSVKLFNQKSLLMTKYAFKGKFGLKSKIISTNIGSFIDQYINVILEPPLKVNITFDSNPSLLFSFDTTVLGIIVDNIISNSIKAKAEKIDIVIENKNTYAVLDFHDDGQGYDKTKIPKPEILFELGARCSDNPGYGIGLYHIKELIKKNTGNVHINLDVEKGFNIVIRLINENNNGVSENEH
jgi:signal transduction histidine kinase